jgi:tRNA threonylcarbamoyladenosine biosynthesis protein TsaE
MKEYSRKITKSKVPMSNKIRNIYHFDAYRVEAEDILNLGWEEIIAETSNVCIIEWADKLEKIIPERAIWIGFEWLDAKRRKLTIGKKDQKLAKIRKAC